MITRIFGRWLAGASNLSLLSSSAIRAAGSISILMSCEKGLGKRPIQLAMGGSCAYPVLADLANDENFHGTIICSIVPRLFFAPPGTPPMERGEKAVRRSHTQTPAQRASQYLAMPLEEHVAFLKQEELTLDELLKRLPIPNRPMRKCRRVFHRTSALWIGNGAPA